MEGCNINGLRAITLCITWVEGRRSCWAHIVSFAEAACNLPEVYRLLLDVIKLRRLTIIPADIFLMLSGLEPADIISYDQITELVLARTAAEQVSGGLCRVHPAAEIAAAVSPKPRRSGQSCHSFHAKPMA